jgi:hypothetical protein
MLCSLVESGPVVKCERSPAVLRFAAAADAARRLFPQCNPPPRNTGSCAYITAYGVRIREVD